MYYISGFYKFKKIHSIKKNKKLLSNIFNKYNIRGTIIISSEGVNGTISSTKKNLDLALNKIKKVLNFISFDSQNLSKSKFKIFNKGKVKIKKEVVPMGIKIFKRKTKNHLEPIKWNKLISNKKTILIDARKPFEYRVGTFKGSINPEIDKFSLSKFLILNSFLISLIIEKISCDLPEIVPFKPSLEIITVPLILCLVKEFLRKILLFFRDLMFLNL